MGSMCHHAIVVTAFKNYIPEAHAKAKEIIEAPDKFGHSNKLVSEIIESNINAYWSFFIAADGSKEGWDDSDLFNERRGEFIKWLRQSRSCSWALIQYGDEENDNRMLECS